MRDYLDNTNKSRKKRIRVYVDNEFAPREEAAPKNASAWTKTGYNRSLRKIVNHYMNPADADAENIDEIEENNDDNNNNQENTDRPQKRNKSVVSEEYDSSNSRNSSSDKSDK